MKKDYVLGMDCGTGPDRLGYGGCAKGLILKKIGECVESKDTFGERKGEKSG